MYQHLHGTFDSNSSSEVTSNTMTVIYGEVLALNLMPTRWGSVFVGWYDAGDGDSNEKSTNDYNKAENCTLYAQVARMRSWQQHCSIAHGTVIVKVAFKEDQCAEFLLRHAEWLPIITGRSSESLRRILLAASAIPVCTEQHLHACADCGVPLSRV